MDTGTLADIPISVWNFNSVHDLELCSSAPHFPNLLTVRESPALLLPDTSRPHLNHSALASRSLSLAPCTLQCSQVLLFTRSTAVSPLAQALLLKHMHFTSSSRKHNSISWWHSSNHSWSPPPPPELLAHQRLYQPTLVSNQSNLASNLDIWHSEVFLYLDVPVCVFFSVAPFVLFPSISLSLKCLCMLWSTLYNTNTA